MSGIAAADAVDPFRPDAGRHLLHFAASTAIEPDHSGIARLPIGIQKGHRFALVADRHPVDPAGVHLLGHGP
jgi:hypothetical protein